MTNVEQMEKWYSANEHHFAAQCSAFRLDVHLPADKRKGKAVLKIETLTAIASITLWNHGDVEALMIDKAAKQKLILDDRRLGAEDKIDFLLEQYRLRITNPD